MTIPRSESYYKSLEPFDPTISFYDADGRKLSYINDPLDETYLVEPTDHFESGSLPPEEHEVRDYLTAAVLLRNRVGKWEFWKSQFLKPTKNYLASLKMFERLNKLPLKSPQHRAAFCRLANGKMLVDSLRLELRKLIEKADNQ